MAAVSVVLPWSTCPIVPMLMWGLILWKTFFSLGAAYIRARPTTGPTAAALCLRRMSFKHLCRGTLYLCTKRSDRNNKIFVYSRSGGLLTCSVWMYLFSWAGDLFLGTGKKRIKNTIINARFATRLPTVRDGGYAELLEGRTYASNISACWFSVERPWRTSVWRQRQRYKLQRKIMRKLDFGKRAYNLRRRDLVFITSRQTVRRSCSVLTRFVSWAVRCGILTEHVFYWLHGRIKRSYTA